MLFLKPHTVTRWKFAEHQTPATLVVNGTFFESPVEIRGQLLPMTAQVALERTGAVQDRPHEWMWDSAADIEVQDLIVYGERWFVAKAPQEVFDAEPTTAHRRIVLQEIDAGIGQVSYPEVA